MNFENINSIVINSVAKNFGDCITHILFSFLSEKKLVKKEFNCEEISFLTTGSHLRMCNKKNVIIGSGFISENDDLGKGDWEEYTNKVYEIPLHILSVRGPKTKEKLDKLNIFCPEKYGDPLILFPLLYLPNVKLEYDIGIIPHYIDKDTENFNNLVERLKINYKVKIIDILTGENYKPFINDICKCRIIISSSLHGVIMGLVYKRRTIFTEFTNGVIGNRFKFEDFFSSLNIKYKIKDSKEESLLDNYIIYEKKELINIGNQILDVIPIIEYNKKVKLKQEWEYFVSKFKISKLVYNNEETLQEYYFKKSIDEILDDNFEEKIIIEIDHYNAICKFNNKIYNLVFPKYMIEKINSIKKDKIINFFFSGVITEKRLWIKKYNESSIIKESYYGRKSDTKYELDMEYYTNICKSKYTLCPTGDCPWSYRFFEAIMCYSIPIMEKNTNDIFCKDFFFFTEDDNYYYDIKKCEENYKKLIEKFTLF